MTFGVREETNVRAGPGDSGNIFWAKNHYPSMTLMISLDMRGAGNEVIMRFAQSHDAPPKTEAGDLDHLKGSHRGELGELRLEPR
jgi:hypothetical protein